MVEKSVRCCLCNLQEDVVAPVSDLLKKVNPLLPVKVEEITGGNGAKKICCKCLLDVALLEELVSKYKKASLLPVENKCYLCLKNDVFFKVTGELFDSIKIIEYTLEMKNLFPKEGDNWKKRKKDLTQRSICAKCFFLLDSATELYERMKDVGINLRQLILVSTGVDYEQPTSEEEEEEEEEEDEEEEEEDVGVDDDRDSNDNDYDVRDVKRIKREIKEEVESDYYDQSDEDEDEIDQQAIIRRIKEEPSDEDEVNENEDEDNEDEGNEDEDSENETVITSKRGRKPRSSSNVDRNLVKKIKKEPGTKKSNRKSFSRSAETPNESESEASENFESNINVKKEVMEEDYDMEHEEGSDETNATSRRGRKPRSKSAVVKKKEPVNRKRNRKSVSRTAESPNESESEASENFESNINVKKEVIEEDYDIEHEEEGSDETNATSRRGRKPRSKSAVVKKKEPINRKRNRKSVSRTAESPNESESEASENFESSINVKKEVGEEDFDLEQEDETGGDEVSTTRRRGGKPRSKSAVKVVKKVMKGPVTKKNNRKSFSKNARKPDESELEAFEDFASINVKKEVLEEEYDSETAILNEEPSSEESESDIQQICSWCSVPLASNCNDYLCDPCIEKRRIAMRGINGKTCFVQLDKLKSASSEEQCRSSEPLSNNNAIEKPVPDNSVLDGTITRTPSSVNSESGKKNGNEASTNLVTSECESTCNERDLVSLLNDPNQNLEATELILDNTKEYQRNDASDKNMNLCNNVNGLNEYNTIDKSRFGRSESQVEGYISNKENMLDNGEIIKTIETEEEDSNLSVESKNNIDDTSLKDTNVVKNIDVVHENKELNHDADIVVKGSATNAIMESEMENPNEEIILSNIPGDNIMAKREVDDIEDKHCEESEDSEAVAHEQLEDTENFDNQKEFTSVLDENHESIINDTQGDSGNTDGEMCT